MDDKRLDRIETKLDDTNEKLGSIDSTLAAQHISLKEHMRRTAMLEKELKPIQKHVSMVQGALKLVSIIAMLAAIIEVLRHI